MMPSHRIASIAASPTRGPPRTTTPASAVRACCFVGVHEHGQHRGRVFDRSTIGAVEGVEADCPQRVRIPCRPQTRSRVQTGRCRLWLQGRRSRCLPAKPGRRPLRRHTDSSRFGSTITYRSLNAISSSTLVIRRRRAARCRIPAMSKPAMSFNRSNVSSRPANRPTATARSNPISTGFDCVFDVGELFEVFGGRNEVSGRFGGYVEAAPHPLTQRPTPRPHRHLPAVNLTQQRHLSSTCSSDHRLRRQATAARSTSLVAVSISIRPTYQPGMTETVITTRNLRFSVALVRSGTAHPVVATRSGAASDGPGWGVAATRSWPAGVRTSGLPMRRMGPERCRTRRR